MYRTEKFQVEHFMQLAKEPINQNLQHMIGSGQVFGLLETEAVTFFKNEQIMICGGITQYWQGRGHLWTVFSEASKEHFVPVFRAVDAWLKNLLLTKYHRIELSMDWESDREMGHKRALMLGFKLEVERAKKYLPTGEDCAIYAMVRE